MLSSTLHLVASGKSSHLVQVPAALHWPDMKLPLALSLRVREAGWLWSGAIGLDTPGDQFCKIRHRYAVLLSLSANVGVQV